MDPQISSAQTRAIVERAVKTVAQALIASVLAGGATTLTGVDWVTAVNIAALSGVMSVITSLASWNIGAPGPSAGAEAPVEDEGCA